MVILTAGMLPFFIKNAELAAGSMMPIIIFMILSLVCLWIFFILNYRLLSLLEKEDWPALAYYLEHKIFTKNRYSNRNVRLLVSSYMVISDYSSVLKLETNALKAKPSTVRKNHLIFGTARILNGNYGEAAVFFNSFLTKIKPKHNEWTYFYYGFSHLLNSSFDLAEPELIKLAKTSNDALITGLSAYFLENNILKRSKQIEDCKNAAETGKFRVIKTLKNRKNWEKEAERTQTDIHITIIRKYINEAGNWLFGEII